VRATIPFVAEFTGEENANLYKLINSGRDETVTYAASQIAYQPSVVSGSKE
jgi:hypothetical protein